MQKKIIHEKSELNGISEKLQERANRKEFFTAGTGATDDEEAEENT